MEQLFQHKMRNIFQRRTSDGTHQKQQENIVDSAVKQQHAKHHTDAVNRAKRSEQKAAFDCLLSADGIQNGFHNPAAHTVQYKPQEIFTDIP